jgi:hypothetical protein
MTVLLGVLAVLLVIAGLAMIIQRSTRTGVFVMILALIVGAGGTTVFGRRRAA